MAATSAPDSKMVNRLVVRPKARRRRTTPRFSRAPHVGIQQDTPSRRQRNKKDVSVAEVETRGNYNSVQNAFRGLRAKGRIGLAAPARGIVIGAGRPWGAGFLFGKMTMTGR